MSDEYSQTFELGGVEIALFSVLDFKQDYEVFGGFEVLRTANGSGVKQSHWKKLKTTISGSGFIPAALSGLDYNNSMVLKCGAKRSISGASVSITLPTARRTDTPHLPLGFAVVKRELVVTTINIANDIATLGTVTGADRYEVHYWPQINVFCLPPSENTDITNAATSWSIVAEEV